MTESSATAVRMEPTRLDPPAAPGSMAPNLAPDGDGVLLSWLEPRDPRVRIEERTWSLRFSRLEEGTWSAVREIVSGREFFANWADFPSITRSPPGWLLAHWAAKSGAATYAYDVALARSDREGARWTRLANAHEDRTETEHGFVTMVPEADRLRAFWLDGRQMKAGAGHGEEAGGDMALRTALVGGATEKSELLDPRVCECCQTSAAMTSDGPIVVYRDRSKDEIRDIAIVRRLGGKWTAPSLVHPDGWKIDGCPVNGPSVAAAGRRAAVAWYTAVGDRPRVRAAFSEDAGKSFGPPVEVDAASPLGRVDVVLDEAGHAIVAWVASEGKGAALKLRRVAPDGALGDWLTLAATSPARTSGFPRLERAGTTLVAAWTDDSDEATRVHAAILPVSAVPAAAPRSPRSQAEAGPGRAWDGKPGSKAPDYDARSLEGRKVSIPGLPGRVVLVNLWATWCGPCRLEMPELAALYRRLGPRGLEVVGVSLDGENASGRLRDFIRQNRIPYTILHDPEDRASGTFGATALPASFLFDRSGLLVWSRVGVIAKDDPDLAAALRKTLG